MADEELYFRIRAGIDIWVVATDEDDALELIKSYRNWEDWDLLGHSDIELVDE